MRKISQAATLRPDPKNGKLTITLLILLLVSLTFCCFLNESIAFFNTPNSKWMNNIEFFLAFAASFLSTLFYLIIAHRYGGAKFKPFYFLLFSALFVGNLIALIAFPDAKTGTVSRYQGPEQGYVYVLGDIERIRFAMMFFSSCASFYCLFAIAPQVMRGKHSLNVIFSAIIFVALFTIFYSFATEYVTYIKYFDINADVSTGDYVDSCFNNRNTYGTILLLGICCLGYLQCESRHWWYYPLILFMYLANVVTLSKTSIICSTFFLVCFLVYRFIQTVRFHPVKDIIALVLTLTFIGFLIYARRSDIPLLNHNVFTKLYDNFLSALSRRVEGTFMEDRTEIWFAIGEMLDTPLEVIFGVGDVNIYFLLAYAFHRFDGPVPLYWAHNGFVHTYAAGGIFRLVIYAIIIFLFLYKAIRSALRNAKSTTAIASIFFMITFLIHGMAETTGFLMPDTKGMVLLVAVFLPVFVEGRQSRGVDTSEPFRGDIKFHYSLSPFRKTALWVAFYTPFLIYALALSEPLTRVLATTFFSSDWYVLASAFALILPLLIFLSYCCKSKFIGFACRYICLILFFASFFLVYFLGSPAYLLLPLVVLPILLVILASTHSQDLARGLWKKVWQLYAAFIFVLLLFTGLNHWVAFAENWFRTSTPTATALYIASNALLLLVVVVASPLSSILLFPLDSMIVHLDERISFLSRRYEVRTSKRNHAYLSKKKKRGRSHYFA